MPQLKRLVPSATDAAAVTPEQLFARALHDHSQQQTRKDAATACAARAYSMASALGGGTQDDAADSDRPLRDIHMPPRGLITMTLEESIHQAIAAANERQKSPLFIVDNAVYVAKRICNAVHTESVEASARDAILSRISLQQTSEIHVLLSILHNIQHLESNRPARIFVGPLSGFFTPFLTTNGLTTTGDGLLRMVQLTCKRLQISQPAIDVTIIRDRPQFES